MTNRIPPVFSSPLLTLVLVLMPSIPAAAQTRPEQDSRIFRTELMGNGYARTGVNTAIYNVFVEGANRRIQFLGGRWTDPNRHHATLATQAGSVPRSVARHPFAPS